MHREPVPKLPVVFLLVLAVAAAARAASPARVVPDKRLAEAAPAIAARSKARLPGPVVAALRGRIAPVAVIPAVSTAATPASLHAPGDALVISKDDDFMTAPAFGYEGRLAVSPAAAGPADHLAFRFAAQDFARSFPVRVTGLEVGFDNRHGRTTWPLLGLKAEDPAIPLQPAALWLAQVPAFSAPATALPAPGVPPGPDAFQRLAVPFQTAVTVASSPSVDDGALSDAFDRAVDETLDNPASDWLECDLAACGLVQRLTVRTQRVEKTAAGDAVAVKFPAATVASRRPVADLDVEVSAAYDVTAAGNQRAGLLARLEALDRFYLAEYREATNEVALAAMTPGGLVDLVAPVPAPGTPVTGMLTLDVRGVHPRTTIVVSIDATTVISHTDTAYQYGGTLAGLASLGASSGERWDDFRVRRRPDLFAVIQLPAGEDAALPAEWSPSSVGFAHVLGSTDGTTFASLAAGAGCVKPPNTFVSLAVADDANLFQVESKLVELELSCAGCSETRSPCAEDLGPDDRRLDVFETGQAIDVNVGWWNEHAPDVDFLNFELVILRGGCSDPNATLETFQDVAIPLDAGQLPPGGPAFRRLASPGLTWTPAQPGTYCAWAIELYDRNADGCFDGWEGWPCPVGCTCVGDPDENASTGVLTRPFEVELPCTPLAVSEIVPNSLRAARDAADLADTDLAWSKTGPLVRQFNVQTTTSRAEVAEPAIRDQAPTFARVLGGVPDTVTVQALPAVPGGVRYFAVFQNDGCPSGWSLADP